MTDNMVRKSFLADEKVYSDIMADAGDMTFTDIMRKLMEAQVNGLVDVTKAASDPAMLVATGMHRAVSDYIASEADINRARAELYRAQARALSSATTDEGRQDLEVWFKGLQTDLDTSINYSAAQTREVITERIDDLSSEVVDKFSDLSIFLASLEGMSEAEQVKALENAPKEIVEQIAALETAEDEASVDADDETSDTEIESDMTDDNDVAEDEDEVPTVTGVIEDGIVQPDLQADLINVSETSDEDDDLDDDEEPEFDEEPFDGTENIDGEVDFDDDGFVKPDVPEGVDMSHMSEDLQDEMSDLFEYDLPEWQ